MVPEKLSFRSKIVIKKQAGGGADGSGKLLFRDYPCQNRFSRLNRVLKGRSKEEPGSSVVR
jgi:hypothetical protein